MRFLLFLQKPDTCLAKNWYSYTQRCGKISKSVNFVGESGAFFKRNPLAAGCLRQNVVEKFCAGLAGFRVAKRRGLWYNTPTDADIVHR